MPEKTSNKRYSCITRRMLEKFGRGKIHAFLDEWGIPRYTQEEKPRLCTLDERFDNFIYRCMILREAKQCPKCGVVL